MNAWSCPATTTGVRPRNEKGPALLPALAIDCGARALLAEDVERAIREVDLGLGFHLRGTVVRVVPQDPALFGQHETGGLDIAADHFLVHAVQLAGVVRARGVARRGEDHDEGSARLERLDHL